MNQKKIMDHSIASQHAAENLNMDNVFEQPFSIIFSRTKHTKTKQALELNATG